MLITNIIYAVVMVAAWTVGLGPLVWFVIVLDRDWHSRLRMEIEQRRPMRPTRRERLFNWAMGLGLSAWAIISMVTWTNASETIYAALRRSAPF